MDNDVIIIGGSFAGLAAATQLGRARRRVAVIDTGLPRNRFSPAAHGVLGHDGRPPAQLLGEALGQLERYRTVRVLQAKAIGAHAEGDGFAVTLADGRHLQARQLILAYGLHDQLPALPGLQQRWGRSVLHCPYCHGFELDQQPIGVLGGHERAFHMGMLLPDWGPTTLFTEGVLPSEAEQQALAARGTRIEHARVATLLGPAPALQGVVLDDGRQIPLAGLFVAPQLRPNSDLAQQLGCAMDMQPMSESIRVDAMQATSVPGVYAAGDLAQPMGNVTLSMAAGVRAAAAVHAAMLFSRG